MRHPLTTPRLADFRASLGCLHIFSTFVLWAHAGPAKGGATWVKHVIKLETLTRFQRRRRSEGLHKAPPVTGVQACIVDRCSFLFCVCAF